MQKKLIDYSFFFHTYPFFTHIVKNEPSPYHSHNFIEIVYILEGNCKHLLNGKEEILSEGSLLILRPRDYHTFLQPEDYPCIRRDVLFGNEFFKNVCDFLSPSFFEDFMNSNHHFNIQLTITKLREFEDTALKIHSLINNHESNENIFALLNVFCCKLLEPFFISKHLLKKDAPKWLLELVDRLDNGVDIITPLTEILSNFNYDITYMRKKFKEYTGLSMTEYRLDTQLKYAITLIKTTDYSIAAIAQKSGFNNLPYFYKTFKEKYGISPSKVRIPETNRN